MTYYQGSDGGILDLKDVDLSCIWWSLIVDRLSKFCSLLTKYYWTTTNGMSANPLAYRWPSDGLWMFYELLNC